MDGNKFGRSQWAQKWMGGVMTRECDNTRPNKAKWLEASEAQRKSQRKAQTAFQKGMRDSYRQRTKAVAAAAGAGAAKAERGRSGAGQNEVRNARTRAGEGGGHTRIARATTARRNRNRTDRTPWQATPDGRLTATV